MHQYLKPLIPLNIPVAIKFAKGLGCKIIDFSPMLAGCIREAIPHLDNTGPLYAKDAIEQQVLTLFRGLPPETQDAVVGNLTRLFNDANNPGPDHKPKLRKVEK